MHCQLIGNLAMPQLHVLYVVQLIMIQLQDRLYNCNLDNNYCKLI